MRRSRIRASRARSILRIRVTPRTLVLAIFFVAVGWLAVSLVQELLLAQHLNQEAARLRGPNAALQRDNQGYQQDLHAGSSAGAAEGNARRSGYAKPGEKEYPVGDAVSPSPSPPRR